MYWCYNISVSKEICMWCVFVNEFEVVGWLATQNNTFYNFFCFLQFIEKNEEYTNCWDLGILYIREATLDKSLPSPLPSPSMTDRWISGGFGFLEKAVDEEGEKCRRVWSVTPLTIHPPRPGKHCKEWRCWGVFGGARYVAWADLHMKPGHWSGISFILLRLRGSADPQSRAWDKSGLLSYTYLPVHPFSSYAYIFLSLLCVWAGLYGSN